MKLADFFKNQRGGVVDAVKKHLVVAAIVVGAIIVAIPVFILGSIRVLWDHFISWARPRQPLVAKRIRQWAQATEARIVGQAGKRNEK